MSAQSVQKYVKEGYLTKKQGANLPPSYALSVGSRNKKKKHKPKPSLTSQAWKAKQEKKRKGKKGKNKM